MGETKKVLTELKNGVLIVTINREERRNAIDPETSAMMEQILNDAEQNPEVGAIIITGTGDRSFCSGEDLAAYDENGTCQTIMAHGFAGITERLSAKPIICAANGTAVAGGLEIALACDIIVASENARFGLSEVKVGFLATSGGLIRLPNIIPKKIASEMVLTGKLIDAQRAYEVGLVNYVVPREQVMDNGISRDHRCKRTDLIKTQQRDFPCSNTVLFRRCTEILQSLLGLHRENRRCSRRTKSVLRETQTGLERQIITSVWHGMKKETM